MKLSELAIIFKGRRIDSVLHGQAAPNDYAYLTPEIFINPEKGVRYISEREVRKLGMPSRHLLQYGDYLLFVSGSEIKLHRFDQVGSRRNIIGEGFIAIRSDFKIVTDFFGYSKNLKYFFEYLKNNVTTGVLPNLTEIGNIEIPTENILELQEANQSEIIGINSPLDFKNDRVDIQQKTMAMAKLMSRIEHGELLLDTEFQRRPGLWEVETKSRFIESMIIQMPVPAFYFYGADDNQWLVIDGLQRLSTTRSFQKGEFSLTKLDYLPDLEGKTFEQLDRPQQRNIEEYEVVAYILRKGTPKAVAYKLFKTINTSGLRLERQEIRHAINPGPPAEFLKRVAESDWFKECVPLSIREQERMENREAVLRFVAFRRAIPGNYQPGSGIADFLDAAMAALNDIPESQRRLYEDELKNALILINSILGNEAFSRTLYEAERKQFSHNNILFETLTYGFSKLSKESQGVMLKEQVEIRESVKQFFKNKLAEYPRFFDSDFAYTIEGVRRFEDMTELLKNYSQQK